MEKEEEKLPRLNGRVVRQNQEVIEEIKTYYFSLVGAAVGIFGVEQYMGVAYYLLSYVLITVWLYYLKLQVPSKGRHHFIYNGQNILTEGIWQNGTTFVLFWILFYASIYAYR